MYIARYDCLSVYAKLIIVWIVYLGLLSILQIWSLSVFLYRIYFYSLMSLYKNVTTGDQNWYIIN